VDSWGIQGDILGIIINWNKLLDLSTLIHRLFTGAPRGRLIGILNYPLVIFRDYSSCAHIHRYYYYYCIYILRFIIIYWVLKSGLVASIINFLGFFKGGTNEVTIH